MWLRVAVFAIICLAVGFGRVYLDAMQAGSIPDMLAEAAQLFFASGFVAFCSGVFKGFSSDNAAFIFRMWAAALIVFGFMMVMGIQWSYQPVLDIRPIPEPEGGFDAL